MKIGILFSGQGAQYPGMMKDLYEEETAAKSYLIRLILRSAERFPNCVLKERRKI
ncbi:MAG: hypothetical protein IKO32_05195 [Lachnospiraceae bacterium]|nr:hypothetical protein [Lachnospiraceae bacterium]